MSIDNITLREPRKVILSIPVRLYYLWCESLSRKTKSGHEETNRASGCLLVIVYPQWSLGTRNVHGRGFRAHD